MNYTKIFEDGESNKAYFVSECCLDGKELKHLVLCEIDGTNVVEVDNNYKGVTVKKVGYIKGELIELSVEEFDNRFMELTEVTE